MKKILGFILIVSLISCSNLHTTMKEPNTRINFEKQDFDFSESLHAKVYSQRFFGIDFKRLRKDSTGSLLNTSGIPTLSIPVIGNVIPKGTSTYAIFKLMTNNPGYDIVFYPQYETLIEKPFGLGLIYRKETVIVRARLAKIK